MNTERVTEMCLLQVNSCKFLTLMSDLTWTSTTQANTEEAVYVMLIQRNLFLFSVRLKQ